MHPKILFILMTMVVLSPMAIDIYLSSVPVMAVEFQASAREIQSIITIFFFAMGLGQIIVGPLADRYGRKPFALLGLIVYVLSSIACSLAVDLWFVQLNRLLQGLAACSISVIIFSVVRDTYSYQRSAKIYSYLNGVLSIVPALAPMFGSFLASYFGWRSTFIFMAVYAFIVLCLVYAYLPETLKNEKVHNKKVTALYNWQRYRSVLVSKYFIFYAVCCMSAMAGILSYVSYAPIWLIEHLQVSQSIFSVLFGMNAVVSIICCFVAPILIRQLGNVSVVKLSLLFMLGSAMSLLGCDWLLSRYEYEGIIAALGFMLPISLLSAGLSLLLGPATSMALSQFGDRAATASSLLGFVQMAGASLVVVLIQQSGLQAPLAVSLVLLLLIVPLLVMINMKYFSVWHEEK